MATFYDQNKPIPEFVQPAQAIEKPFYEDQLLLYQKRTVQFMRASFPSLASTLSDAHIEKLALAVMHQAELSHYVTEREIWQYLIVVAYCGFYFDTDPQYAHLLHAAGWNVQGADRTGAMNRLLDLVDEYYVQCEEDFAAFNKKLKSIIQFYMGWNYSSQLTGEMRTVLAEKMVEAVFPIRWAMLAQPARQLLLTTSLQHADHLGFPVKDGIIYTLAAIYFGHAFEQSPVYPWAHFLADRDIPAASRAKQFIDVAQKHFSSLVL